MIKLRPTAEFFLPPQPGASISTSTEAERRGFPPCRPLLLLLLLLPLLHLPPQNTKLFPDISPNAAMRAPKSSFLGKCRRRRRRRRRGRHVWRLRARTASPPTKNSTRRRALVHGPAYSRAADWPRRSSICTRDMLLLTINKQP